jgi:hypothetical protein
VILTLKTPTEIYSGVISEKERIVLKSITKIGLSKADMGMLKVLICFIGLYEKIRLVRVSL